MCYVIKVDDQLTQIKLFNYIYKLLIKYFPQYPQAATLFSLIFKYLKEIEEKLIYVFKNISIILDSQRLANMFPTYRTNTLIRNKFQIRLQIRA